MKTKNKKTFYSLGIGLIFSIVYYIFIIKAENLIRLILSIIPLILSLLIIYPIGKRIKKPVEFIFLILLVLSFLGYVLGIFYTSDEIIGYYIGYAPFILFFFIVLPLTLMTYIIMKIIGKK